ncbi:hypothetical protein P879_00816 [Paragonimus westermani]|uniref:DUF3719 domain-containing protein n=1 Tax=Paragonimus westermani TaxID=34504 RepID=A0A8T0DXU6_9TREM|nr:hypothetical protein P879_00816 [Paragonimus westermani]
MVKQALTGGFLLNSFKVWLIRGLLCESVYDNSLPETISSEFLQMKQTDFKTADLTMTVTGQNDLTAPILNFRTSTKTGKTVHERKQLGVLSTQLNTPPCKPHILKTETHSNFDRTHPGKSSNNEYFINRPCLITTVAASHMRPTSIRSDGLELPTENLRRQQSTVREQEYTKESSVSEWLLQCNNASLNTKDGELVTNKSMSMDRTHLQPETNESQSITYSLANNQSHTCLAQQFITSPSSSYPVNSQCSQSLFIDHVPIKITESHNFVRSTTNISKFTGKKLTRIPVNDGIVSQCHKSTNMTQYPQYADPVERPSGSKVGKSLNQDTDWNSISSSEWGDDICEFDRLQSRRVQQMFEDIDCLLFDSPELLKLQSAMPPKSAQSRKSCKNDNTQYSMVHLERECQDWLHRFPHLRIVGTQIVPSEESGFVFCKSTNEAVQSKMCSPTTSDWVAQNPQTLKYRTSETKRGISQVARNTPNPLFNENEGFTVEQTNQKSTSREHDSQFITDSIGTNIDPESDDVSSYLLKFYNEDHNGKYEEIIAADDQDSGSRINVRNRQKSYSEEKTMTPTIRGHHCDLEVDRLYTDPKLVRPSGINPSKETLLSHIRRKLCQDISDWLKLTNSELQNSDTIHTEHPITVSEPNKSTTDYENVNFAHADQKHCQYQQHTSPDPTCESWEVNSQFKPLKQFTGGGRLQSFSEKNRSIQTTRASQLCAISQSTTSSNPVGLSDLLQISTKALQQRDRPILEHLDIQKTSQPSFLTHGVDENTLTGGGNQWNPTMQRLSPQPFVHTVTRPFSCLSMKLMPHSSRKSGIVTCSTQPESSCAPCGSGVVGVAANLYHVGKLAPLEIVPTHLTMPPGSISEDIQTHNSTICLNTQVSMESTANCSRTKINHCTVSHTICPNVTAITTFTLNPVTNTHTQVSALCPDVKTTNIPAAISTDTIAGRICTLPPLSNTGTVLPVLTNTSSQAIGLSGSSVPITKSLHSLNFRTGSVVQHSHAQTSAPHPHVFTGQNPPEIRGANVNLVTQQINNSGMPTIPNSQRTVRWISSRPGPEQYRSPLSYRFSAHVRIILASDKTSLPTSSENPVI